MTEPEGEISYSCDLWDYLHDLPYMPGREDRDRLVDAAARDPSKSKRVQLWDYFFALRPDDVGIPIRIELQSLRTRLDNLRGKHRETLASRTQRLRKLREDAEAIAIAIGKRLATLEASTRASLLSAAKLRLVQGILTLLPVGLAMFLGLGYMTQVSLQDRPGCEAFLGATSFGCISLFLFPVGIVGLWLSVLGLVRMSPDFVQRRTAEETKTMRDGWTADREKQLAEIGAEENAIAVVNSTFAVQEPLVVERIEELERILEHLLAQIPPRPSPERVELWLQEDLARLRDEAVTHSGLVDSQLQDLDGGDNPICIRGPAELQDLKLIHPFYRKSGSYQLHLRAKLFHEQPDATKIEHYGVCAIEFLILATDVLACHTVFFDFIEGEVIGRRVALQHYQDVVLIENRSYYVEIPCDGPKQIKVVLIRSLSLSLASGDRIEIRIATDDYLEKMGANFKQGGQRQYDPFKVAESARRNIQGRVDQAKENREKSRGRSTVGPEKSDLTDLDDLLEDPASAD